MTPRTALCLLALTGCATPQKAPPTPAPPGKLARDGNEPGTLSLVPVGSAAESQRERDAARPSMALASAKPTGNARSEPAPVPPGEASAPSRSGSNSELKLRERIQNTLARHGSLSYTAKRISVEVNRQNVLLTGDVRTARERAEVQETVEKVEGVGRVNNQLVIIDQPQPVAP